MKQGIILGAAAALASAAIILFRQENQREKEYIYRRGKEDGIKEQVFRAKSYPPPPKVISDQLHKWDIFREASLQWLFDMVLCNKIALQDIPREVRVEDDYIYIAAFRLSSRGGYFPVDRFVKDLTTICEDICSLDDDRDKDGLVETFSRYLNNNEHEEDEEFVNFKKNLSEEILWELRKRGKISREAIDKQLRDRGIK